MKLAEKLSRIDPFKVMALLARANELADLGHDVIHLEVGEPDFPTPAPILAAGHAALTAGATKYTDARGLLALRQSVSDFYQTHFDVNVSAERIFITAGASGGLLLLAASLMNSGDNLLMTDPGYPCNRHFLTAFGAEGRLVPVSADNNFQLTPELIHEYWNEQTRGVLIASPANPTGTLTKGDEMQRISAAVREHAGVLVVDEIYQGLTYDGCKPATVLSLDDGALVINSFSKYFGMTGWRLGWVVIPETVTSEMVKLAQNLFICPSSIAQHAALAAFTDDALGEMETYRESFEARRNYMLPAIRRLGFDVAAEPQGAFYIYAALPADQPDAEEFCSRLLEEQFVAVTPGTDFGFEGANRHIRISYARELSQLEQAITRIGRFIQ